MHTALVRSYTGSDINNFGKRKPTKVTSIAESFTSFNSFINRVDLRDIAERTSDFIAEIDVRENESIAEKMNGARVDVFKSIIN